MYHPRNDKLLPLARNLRKEMTREEKRLWYQYLRQYPVRFRRQEIIGGYIADFYCSAAKLVVELDGSQHFEDAEKEKDEQRTQTLKKFGCSVVRIPNNEVKEHFEAVCDYIDEAVKNALKGETPQSAALTAPLLGELKRNLL